MSKQPLHLDSFEARRAEEVGHHAIICAGELPQIAGCPTSEAILKSLSKLQTDFEVLQNSFFGCACRLTVPNDVKFGVTVRQRRLQYLDGFSLGTFALANGDLKRVAFPASTRATEGI